MHNGCFCYMLIIFLHGPFRAKHKKSNENTYVRASAQKDFKEM